MVHTAVKHKLWIKCQVKGKALRKNGVEIFRTDNFVKNDEELIKNISN